MGVIFSRDTIDLKTVCDTYGVARNMNALNEQKYYDSYTGENYTIKCSPGNSFSLNDLRGFCSNITEVKINESRGLSGSAGSGGHGVNYSISFRIDVLFFMCGRLVGMLISVSLSAGPSGSESGAWVKDWTASVTSASGTTKYTSSDGTPLGVYFKPTVTEFHVYIGVTGEGSVFHDEGSVGSNFYYSVGPYSINLTSQGA